MRLTRRPARHPAGSTAERRRAGPVSRRREPGPGQLSLLEQCLGERDRAVLAFAAAQHFQGGVAGRVHAELGCSELRYTRELAALLDRPEAADAQPALVAALRALRDRRRQRRTAALPTGRVAQRGTTARSS